MNSHVLLLISYPRGCKITLITLVGLVSDMCLQSHTCTVCIYDIYPFNYFHPDLLEEKVKSNEMHLNIKFRLIKLKPNQMLTSK